MELAEALELVARLSRTRNYPKDEPGVVYLAEGLIRAVKETGTPPAHIIAKCGEWCPSDAELISIARELKAATVQVGPRSCPLDLCDGSGWREIFHLHTRHARPGGAAYVEKEIISRQAYDQISRQVYGTNQSVYESRYRCKCHPARPEEIEKRGKYA